MSVLANNADCPSFHDHTPAPAGYIQWHEWAARLSRTHRQVKCTGCGLYAIWVPRSLAGSKDKEGRE